MTTPLRFPGQYFDAETGAHENWNRFYEPKLGRYLSPEPMLQSSGYVTAMAARGLHVPTYAYANNNPLRYVDPTGLWVSVDPQFQVAYDAMKLFLTPDELRQLTILENDPSKGVHITPRFNPVAKRYFAGTRGAFTFPRSMNPFACGDPGPHKNLDNEEDIFIDSYLAAEWWTQTFMFNSTDILIYHELFSHHFSGLGSSTPDEIRANALSNGYIQRVYGRLGR